MNYFEQNKPVIAEWSRRVANDESLEGLEFRAADWMRTGALRNPDWVSILYRFAPKTVTINGYEVVAPMSEKPKEGFEYSFFYAASKDPVLSLIWRDHSCDNNTFRFGIFTNAEDARRYGLALHNIDPNTPVEEL